MAQISFTGVIESIGEKISVKENFEKVEIVTKEKTGTNYDSHFLIQAINKSMADITELRVGDVVFFTCEVSGRKIEKDGRTMFFNNIAYINHNILSHGTTAPGNDPAVSSKTPTYDGYKERKAKEAGLIADDAGEPDDLPF